MFLQDLKDSLYLGKIIAGQRKKFADLSTNAVHPLPQVELMLFLSSIAARGKENGLNLAYKLTWI